MTTQTALKPIDPIFINTPTGTVSVFGHEHVSKRMLEVIGTILSHDAFETVYHGVKSIVFRTDGYPMKNDRSILASFSPDVGGISINLQKTGERAIERSIEHPETNVLASWWIEMIMNFSHEIHHGVRWNTNRDELHNDEDKRMEEEERAEKYSEGLLVDLAKEYNIEPPEMSDEVWFTNHMNEFFKTTEEDQWTQAQETLISNKQMWNCKTDDGKEIVITSFKDLVCMLTNEDIESDIWTKPTIEVPAGILTLDEQINGKKVTIDATGTMTEYVQEQLAPVTAPVEVTADVAFVDDEYYDEDSFGAEENKCYTEQLQPVTPVVAPVQPVQEEEAHTDTTSEHVAQNMADVARIAQQVYTKMYNHIFTQCGPQKDSDVGFTNPEAVCSKPIILTAEESSLFTSMNHLDINGRWCTDVPTINGLLGKVMKNTKLPAYEVNLTVNGVTHKRMLMPQNPAKTNATGQPTQRALEARAGNSIAYVMNPSDNTANKWGPSIINGEYKLPRTNG